MLRLRAISRCFAEGFIPAVTASIFILIFAQELDAEHPISIRLYSEAGGVVYRGQLVTISLDISFADSQMPSEMVHLEIPWLASQFGFRWRIPPEQWLCRHSLFEPGSLACRIMLPPQAAETAGLPVRQHTVYAPLAKSAPLKIWRLSWQLIIDKPLFGEQIRFEPAKARLGGLREPISSSPVSLLVRDPPPPLGLQPTILLPPGRYSVAVSFYPGEVYLGQPVELCLSITGTGALEDLDVNSVRQMLTQQLGVTVHFKGESWEGNQTRIFRWHWLPETAGSWVIPPISALSFDPHSDMPGYRQMQTAATRVEVVPPPPEPPAESSDPMPRLSLRKVSDLQLPWQRQSQLMLIIALMLLLLGPVLLFTIIGGWAQHHRRLFLFPYYSSEARDALACLNRELRKERVDSHEAWRVIQHYLRQRCAIPTNADRNVIIGLIAAHGVPYWMASQFVDLCGLLEHEAFSPVPSGSSNVIKEVIKALKTIDLLWYSQPRGRKRTNHAEPCGDYLSH